MLEAPFTGVGFWGSSVGTSSARHLLTDAWKARWERFELRWLTMRRHGIEGRGWLGTDRKDTHVEARIKSKLLAPSAVFLEGTVL